MSRHNEGGDCICASCGNPSAQSSEAFSVRVPPQPSPPSRLPRYTRGRRRSDRAVSGSSFSSISPEPSQLSHVQNLTPSRASEVSDVAIRPPSGVVEFQPPERQPTEQLARQPTEQLAVQTPREVCWCCPKKWWNQSHVGSAVGHTQADQSAGHNSASVSPAVENICAEVAFREEQQATVGGNPYLCCFRNDHDGRCNTILEDIPTIVEENMVIELHTLLMKHSIEPTNSLINDVLSWEAQVSQRMAVTSGSSDAIRSA